MRFKMHMAVRGSRPHPRKRRPPLFPRQLPLPVMRPVPRPMGQPSSMIGCWNDVGGFGVVVRQADRQLLCQHAGKRIRSPTALADQGEHRRLVHRAQADRHCRPEPADLTVVPHAMRPFTERAKPTAPVINIVAKKIRYTIPEGDRHSNRCG